MKVTNVTTKVIENMPPYRAGGYLLFLEIETDEGITGLGERITGNTYSDRLGDLQSQDQPDTRDGELVRRRAEPVQH